jgi:hypothetical protein
MKHYIRRHEEMALLLKYEADVPQSTAAFAQKHKLNHESVYRAIRAARKQRFVDQQLALKQSLNKPTKETLCP